MALSPGAYMDPSPTPRTHPMLYTLEDKGRSDITFNRRAYTWATFEWPDSINTVLLHRDSRICWRTFLDAFVKSSFNHNYQICYFAFLLDITCKYSSYLLSVMVQIPRSNSYFLFDRTAHVLKLVYCSTREITWNAMQPIWVTLTFLLLQSARDKSLISVGVYVPQ